MTNPNENVDLNVILQPFADQVTSLINTVQELQAQIHEMRATPTFTNDMQNDEKHTAPIKSEKFPDSLMFKSDRKKL